MRFGYADPPYPGLAKKYYEGHPDYAGEVDHRALLSRLQAYDGWALSTSADALPEILALCRELGLQVRVAVWYRGERRVPSAWPLSSWEPVVYAGGRRLVSTEQPADTLVHVARPRTTDPARVIGAKPAAFAYWLFGLLGARGGDELDDLFPGSGGIARAWAVFQQASHAGVPDASVLPGADPSGEASDDTSQLEHGHASGPPGGDVSFLPRGDRSEPGRTDASVRALGDVSRAARADTSPEYSADASALPRGDASPSAASDASCRTSATANHRR